jgi:anti-anti-sigma factor
LSKATAGACQTEFNREASVAATGGIVRPHRVEGDDIFSVSLTYDDSLFVIEPFGELCLASAGRFEEVIDRAVESPSATILVDLSGLDFMDSSGIRVLMRALDPRSADRFRFLRPAPEVGRTLAVCGLDRELEFLD